MQVEDKVCNHCGLTTEVRFFRGEIASSTSCPGCGQPFGKPDPVQLGAQTGALQLDHIPGRGLGVRATQSFTDGSLVERCPALVLGSTPDVVLDTKTFPYTDMANGISLRHLLFPWVEDTKRAIVLGYAMLYNHEPSNVSNLRYEPYVEPTTGRRFVDFYAKRDIEAGEELTQTYAAPNRLWFDYKPGRKP